MHITLLQMDIVWGQPAANYRRIEAMIKRHPDADLYVLPEMFPTGFCIHPEGLADSTDESLQWMQQLAGATQAAIAGSVAVSDGKNYYNRFYFVEPDGKVTAYDKRHLFTFGGEQRSFTAGKKRVVVHYHGVRILLQTCYDLRFPVWARNRGDYDLILYVASWPDTRIAAWKILLQARAIENQCYVAGVNRVGKDAQCTYSGASQLVDAYGNICAAAEDYQEEAISWTLDLDKLQRFRTKFPVLADADDWMLR